MCVYVSWFSVANRSHHLLFSLLFMIDWISFFLLSLLFPCALSLSLALSICGLVRLRSRSSAVFSLRFNNKAKEDQKSFNEEGEKSRSFFRCWILWVAIENETRFPSIFPSTALAHVINRRNDICMLMCAFASYSYFPLSLPLSFSLPRRFSVAIYYCGNAPVCLD